jgi:hypothetical protein
VRPSNIGTVTIKAKRNLAAVSQKEYQNTLWSVCFNWILTLRVLAAAFFLLGLAVELKRPGAEDSKSTVSGPLHQKTPMSEMKMNLLSGLPGFVSMDMTEPLSCACMVSTPNRVHQNDKEHSHSYEWNTQSSDLTIIPLPDDLVKERDCASKSRDLTTNTGDKQRQILWSRRVRIV